MIGMVPNMKPKFFPILEMCIDNGISFGLNRAYKHDDDPSREVMAENIKREIETQLYEWFDMENVE
jgi:hypothetical protein